MAVISVVINAIYNYVVVIIIIIIIIIVIIIIIIIIVSPTIVNYFADHCCLFIYLFLFIYSVGVVGLGY